MSHRSSERKSANGLNMMKSLFRHSQLDSILLSLSLKPAKSGLGPILSKGTSFFQHWLQFPFLLQSPWYKSTQPSQISNVQRCESVIVDLKTKRCLKVKMQSMTHSCQKWGSSSLSCIYFMLCVAENHKHGTHDTSHLSVHLAIFLSIFSAKIHQPRTIVASCRKHVCFEKWQHFPWPMIIKVDILYYFGRRINFVFGWTWEEISCKKYCLVFADLDFCNPKRGPCLAIILFHLPSTESTNINNHHVLQYLPLQWRCLA